MKKLLSLLAILGLAGFVIAPIYAQEEAVILDEEPIVAEAEDIEAADEDVAYLIGTNEDFIRDNGERIEAGRLRIGNIDATTYSAIGS